MAGWLLGWPGCQEMVSHLVCFMPVGSQNISVSLALSFILAD